MLKIDHGTMPTTRKSSITSDEYMEIRRQQNKDAQRRWREKRRLEREAGEALTKSIRKKELSPSNGNNKIKLPLPPPSLSATNLTRPRNGSSSTNESIQSPNFTLQPITNTNHSHPYHHHHHQRLPPIQPPPSQHIPMMNGVAPPHPAYSPALYPSSPPSRHHQNQQSFYPFDDPTMGERLYHASQQPNFEISKLTWSELIVLACFQPSVQQQQSSSSNRNNEMILPNMNFAKAFIENARCLGLDLGYVTDPNSLSFISRDWQAFQNDHQHQQQQQQNHHQRNLARRRSSITGNDNSLSIRRRASSNTSSSSSNSSSQRMFNNGNGNSSNGFPNGTTLPALSISEHNHLTITSSRLHWDKVPFNLYPTESQLRIDHHPFLDIAFPWPSMREKVLTMLANSIIDEIELIDDCFQSSLSSSLKQNQFAFLIWGNDPSDPFSWEISENFAQKWWFLLDEEIIHRSNWWRKQRNLPPLRRGDRKSSS